MNGTLFESSISSREVMLIHPYSQFEVQNPTFGGTRLIAEQIAYLKENGNRVRVISLAEMGSITSLIFKLQERFRKASNDGPSNKVARNQERSEQKRWQLNLFQILVNEYLPRIDFLFRHAVKSVLKSAGQQSVIIYHYPFGSRLFAACAKKNNLQFVLYEHNIEWQFFGERLASGLVRKLLLPRARMIELNSMENADLVAFASEKDRNSSIAAARKTASAKMVTWMPISSIPSTELVADIPQHLRSKTQNKFIIGFVGSNFAPNITAVHNILDIARSCPNSVLFLIVGSVGKAFNHHTDIPLNTSFEGYVQNLHAYLSVCDIFINPKTTSDTGIETKMLDYLKHDKKILSTEIGARGFEDFGNMIVTKPEDMANAIVQLQKVKYRC